MTEMFTQIKVNSLRTGWLIVLSAMLFQPLHAQHIPFTSNRSLTWEESIQFYTTLDASSDIASLQVAGKTDIGKPLHLFVINKDGIFSPELFDRNKTILLINNSIHPGEPDGADACAMLCNEILTPGSSLAALLDSLIICIIPVYNVDGALRRNSHSRANQDGPEAYGFRGNARNLDLNRDFIKCDSENARSFNRLFRRVKPHVFVDTHVSNGADYPYVMTLISTQFKKLGGVSGEYLHGKMEPALFDSMSKKGWEMTPYVNTMGRTPDSGLVEFLETPRFSTGYAALFNTLSFVTETHMLKPFPQRVESTYQFLLSLMEYCDARSTEIIRLRQIADANLRKQENFALNFELDTNRRETFRFSGYQALHEPALAGNGKRLRYDRDSSWQRDVPYYRNFEGRDVVSAPNFYLIPQAWREVIDRLKNNQVLMRPLDKDSLIYVEVTFVENYETATRPYEGHFNHSKITIRREMREVQFYKGDWIIPTDQEARRYLVETLEPQGEDSFFAWNFFDSVLQQKEWFSDYVFEDRAAELLDADPVFRGAFEEAVQTDPALKDNHWQQLYWIYKRSPYYEGSAGMLPVFRGR